MLFESLPWRDISQVLKDKLKDAREQLEVASSIEAMRLLQGRIDALKTLIMLPRELAAELKQQQDLERENG